MIVIVIIISKISMVRRFTITIAPPIRLLLRLLDIFTRRLLTFVTVLAITMESALIVIASSPINARLCGTVVKVELAILALPTGRAEALVISLVIYALPVVQTGRALAHVDDILASVTRETRATFAPEAIEFADAFGIVVTW